MFDKKQRSCLERFHLVTDNGLYVGKASDKKIYIIFTFFRFFVYVMFYIGDLMIDVNLDIPHVSRYILKSSGEVFYSPEVFCRKVVLKISFS